MSQISISSEENDEKYDIEKILDKKIQQGTTYYLIKWQGYSESQNTWEPMSNLKYVVPMVDEFEETQRLIKRRKKDISTSSSDEKQQMRKGCYEDCDSADEVLNVRNDPDRQTMMFEVSWKGRKGRKKPQGSWLTVEELRDHNPEVLCDYLAKKIKFV